MCINNQYVGTIVHIIRNYMYMYIIIHLLGVGGREKRGGVGDREGGRDNEKVSIPTYT